MICGRCGWFIPADCTCRRVNDPATMARLRGIVDQRHRASAARASKSGWAVELRLAG